jgi:hypothetical protein
MQDPAIRLAAVTKSDTTDLGPVRAIYVGGAGNLVLKCKADDGAVTLTAVAPGAWYPIRARFVMDATTATDIVAMY